MSFCATTDKSCEVPGSQVNTFSFRNTGGAKDPDVAA